MTRASENLECQLLDEFTDDGTQPRREPAQSGSRSGTGGLRELVHDVANEMAVPQFNLNEIVEKVLAGIGSQIEQALEATNEECLVAVNRLQITQSSLLRMTLKITARAFQDGHVRELIRRLLVLHPSGKCIAAVHGQMRDVEAILKHADEQNDELCLKHLQLYAEQIIAREK